MAVSVHALAWLSRWRVLVSSCGGGADLSGVQEGERWRCAAGHRMSGTGRGDRTRLGRVPVLWMGVEGSIGASMPRRRAEQKRR